MSGDILNIEPKRIDILMVLDMFHRSFRRRNEAILSLPPTLDVLKDMGCKDIPVKARVRDAEQEDA